MGSAEKSGGKRIEELAWRISEKERGKAISTRLCEMECVCVCEKELF